MSSTTTAPAPKVAPRTLDHAKVIMVLGIVTILTLVPPLVLEVLLYQTASNVGQSTNADRVGTLLSTIQSESAGAMLLLRTVGTSTLTPFQRSAPFVQACATTDAAISDLSSHDEAADQLRQIEQRLSKLRDGVTRDGSLTALYVQAQYADVNVLASSLLLTLASQTNPEVSVRLSRATALSDAAGAWSRGVEPLHAAAESTSQSFQSPSAYQDFATAAKDAELALTHVRALQASSDTLQAVDTSRTVTTATTTTVASVTKTALDSAVSAAPTSSLTVPTAALTDGSAQRLATEFGTAMVTAANVEPTVSLELAQMLVTICACASVLAAIASIAYAISAGIASRHASGAHDAAITHMDNAYKRVVKLMDCMLHFDGEIPFQVVDGPALSPVEAELRALLKPMAKAISHVPRSALTRPMGAPSDDDPLAELDAEPSLRHNVTIMIIDLHFFDDMAVAGDAAKTLPGRANRLRGSVSSEVQRRGGVPVLAPVTRWAFAWNLTGHEKAGIQNATQCALSIIGANSVDYPTMRIVVLTGSVAVGSAGTSTFRTEILAGLPVLLIPLALRVARYHHSQLIVDADTHAHCSSQAYRARPVEVVGVDESSNGTVLYDMLSNLDSHDQRLLQWCEAFEKYHARRVKDALEAFRAWAKDGADRTVNRLIRQLEASPPRPITIGEAPAEVFSHIPSQQ